MWLIWTAMSSRKCKRFAFGAQRPFLSMCSTDPAVPLTGAHPAAGQATHRVGIRSKQVVCDGLDRGQQGGIAHQVGYPHFGETGLAGAEQLARSAQLEI